MNTHKLNTRLVELIETRDILKRVRENPANTRYSRWKLGRRIARCQRQIDATLEQLSEARAKADREQASV